MPINTSKMPHRKSVSNHRNTYHPKTWWHDHYHAWQSSGLSKSTYCKKHGINRSSFANWTRRFDQEPTLLPNSESSSVFFKVAPTSKQPTTQASQAGSVTVKGITVVFDSPADSTDCLTWIKTLQSC
jgi:hypothetical protein